MLYLNCFIFSNRQLYAEFERKYQWRNTTGVIHTFKYRSFYGSKLYATGDPLSPIAGGPGSYSVQPNANFNAYFNTDLDTSTDITSRRYPKYCRDVLEIQRGL